MQEIDNEKLENMIEQVKVIFADTIREVAITMLEGKKKYPKDNWAQRDDIEHIKHIFNHLVDFAGDDSLKKLEDLTHATTRCMMLTQKFIQCGGTNANKTK
jgi:hypothetical protein